MKDNRGWFMVCVILVVVCIGLIVGLIYVSNTKNSKIVVLQKELTKYEAVAPRIYIIKNLHPRSHIVMVDYCSELSYAYHPETDKWLGHGFENGRCIVDVIEYGFDAGYPISKLCPEVREGDSSVPVIKNLEP